MFSSRIQAGKLLAEGLRKQHITADMVLGIARGGVVVAAEIAKNLHLPLDVLVVKKLGAPQNPELAIGALTYDDVTYIDEKFAAAAGADKLFLMDEVKRKHHEFIEREKLLRDDKLPPVVASRSVILVDDGVATGATVIAGIEWLRKKHAAKVILALPVISVETLKKLSSLIDEYVILDEPEIFHAVGEFYRDFQEVSEEEVKNILHTQNAK